MLRPTHTAERNLTTILLEFVRKHPVVLSLFGLSLLVRLAVFFLYHDDFWYKTYLIDDSNYFGWAHGILGGDFLSLKEGVFKMNPGYAYTLALIYLIFVKSTFSPHLVQYFVGSVNVVLIYLLAKKLFDSKTAVVSGMIAALYGMSVFYQGKLLAPVWINFFNLLMLLCLVKARENNLFKFYLFAGAALGVSSLYLPTIFIFAPFALIWIVFIRGGGICLERKRLLAQGGVFVLGISIVVFPVILRNIIIDNKFGLVLTTSAGGINFFMGNNPEANGYNAWPSFIRYSPRTMHEDFRKEAERRSNSTLSDSQVSSYWFKESIRWMKDNPAKALKLLYRKSVYFINAVEPPDNFMIDSMKKFTRIFGIPLVSWGVVIPFAILGLGFCFIYRKGSIIGLYLGAYFLMNMMFYMLSRYRFPAVIAVIILAGFCLMRLYELHRSRKWKYLLLAAAILVPLYLFAHKKVIEGELQWSKHYSVGVIYGNTGHADTAIEEYKKSIELNPSFPLSRINLGNLYVKKEEYSLALEHYEAAAKLDSEKASLIFELCAKIYFYQLKDFENAKVCLKKAKDIGNKKADIILGEMYMAREEYEKAFKIFDDMYKVDGNNHFVIYKLGVLYMYAGRLDLAEEYMKKVLELKPDLDDAKRTLEYIRNKKK